MMLIQIQKKMKRFHKDKGKVVTIEDKKNTLKYQETMIIDIEKLPVQIKKIGNQYMKLFMMFILNQ